MPALFDDIIFVLSTDCFGAELLNGCPDHEIKTVQAMAREKVPETVNGGNNYYMCADFFQSED